MASGDTGSVLSRRVGPAHRAPRPSRASRIAQRANRSFLPEIQVLRAVAVMLVVLYHFWPGRLTGGYVGVDAFFVISGYLITSHLLREVDRTGTLRLWAFYARRARRLLPASIFVLLFVVVATFLLLPADRWSSTAHEVTASGFYVQNLWLASKAVTYSASNEVTSPVVHYWSLSAEEQFYLLWPGLIVLSCVAARRWLGGRSATTVGFTLLLVTASSLAVSVWATQTHRAAAYFITPTRAWEFGAGALVVLLMRRWAPPLAFARLLRWLGLLGLLAAGWLFSGATPFPGVAAALPVVATAAVIVAGDTGRADPSAVVFRLRPVQWLGDASYSIYLWHWPLLMFAPYVLRRDLGTSDLLTLVVLTLVISGLSRYFVEDATRFWPLLTRTPRATLLAAGAGMLVIALVCSTQVYAAGARERQIEALLADAAGNRCFGAPAMENRARCPEATTALPVATITGADAPWALEPACHGASRDARADQTCFWGTGKPTRVVALVGDSHAQGWRAPLHQIAKAKNWQIIEMFAGGCPANNARNVIFERPGRDSDECRSWTTKVTAELKALHPDDIITTAFAQNYVFEPVDAGPTGFEQVWQEWLRFSRVTVLRDIPTTGNRNGPQCLAVNVGKSQACSNRRSNVLLDDDMMRAARRMDKVNLVDLSDSFCDANRCYAVIGGASVYYDHDHMSNQFSATLASALLRRLPKT